MIKMSYKNTVVFIHGFRKEAASWNMTSTGKPIQIQETIAKKNNTILIQMTEDDYNMPVTKVAEQIYNLKD